MRISWYILGFVALTSTACDNIGWGGMEFAIVPPPPVGGTPATGRAEPGERLPDGPVLYYVRNSSNGGIVMPVGEISGDSMLPIRAQGDPAPFAQRFVGEHLRQGAEFVLFRNGSRVGTLLVQSAQLPAPGTCPALPRAIGTMELVPGADTIPEFLAIAGQYAPEIRRRSGAPLAVSRTMQVLGPILAEKMIRARQAPLPGNWQRAMKQLRPIPVSGSPEPGFAASFVVGDSLGLGGDNEGYSLFYVGVPAQFSFDTVFVQFSNFAQGGKAAPRIIDFLDWNRDDQPELLLQVYGIRDAWFETVGRNQRNVWRRTFQDRCRPAAVTSVAPPAGDSINRAKPR
jgi:hypothetical protein